MPIPTTIADLNTTESSNSPAGTDSIGTSADDYIRAIQAIVKQQASAGADIASSGTIAIPAAGSYFKITGTTTITTISDSWTGRSVWIRFAGALTLTNSASLVLPGGANITTAAGDHALVVNSSAGVWHVAVYYDAASGTVLRPTAGQLQGQTYTAFTSAGSSPTFTLTPSPALVAYAPNQRFRVSFHASGVTGSNTLNISGLGAKNVKQYDAAGTKIPATVVANQLADVEYDGTDMVILNPLPLDPQIQPISASVAASALTISASQLSLDFRSTTLGSGAVSRVTGTPANLVISSGSTLGTVNAVASRIAVLAINNAGTIELAAVNLAGGNNLDETTLISTTAEGGAGAADSANVIYSTTARTNVAFRVIGYIESTQATAGTWATAPSTIQGAGGQAATAMQSFGFGQTYQSVTRTSGTTYYNTTGKTIFLVVVFAGAQTGTLSISVGGVSMQPVSNGASLSFQASGTVPIPPGASYVVTGGSYAAFELR
ncbi:MAG TPA: hypothetical protein VLT92_02720 [Burkholderiales bacterium]|nr:hypothetical protein [Burkholderiales bacterium]